MNYSRLTLLCALMILVAPPANPQQKSSLCTRPIAHDMIQQQIGQTRSFNDPVQRITILMRAAEVLWPYQQNRAREVFTEAFEVATQHEKEKDSKRPKAEILILQVADQRYVVLAAIARKDSAWSRELASQILKTRDGDATTTTGSVEKAVHASRLLVEANKLIATDFNFALDLARVSLNYSASFLLTYFLYRVAEINPQAADQFYTQALTRYADKPLREILYLQAYPFAWTYMHNTAASTFHEPPVNFVPNKTLQRQLIQVLVRRAQQALVTPLDPGDNYQGGNPTPLPGAVHLLNGLIRVEPSVRQSHPDLLGAVMDAREKILVTLSPESQTQLLQPGREISTTPVKTFDERIEEAKKTPDPDDRDGLISVAVFGATEKESVEQVVQAIDGINDSQLRTHLLEWFYFQRATTAIKEKRFEEAEKWTSRVEGLEQRAHLHAELAKVLLQRADQQIHAREVLDQAISEAKKVGVSIFAARTLLTASSLYSRIDTSRTVEILSDAITGVNRIEAPDFIGDDQAVEKEIVRKGTGGRYQGHYRFRFYMPGLDIEKAFREMAKVDFDTSLAQSSAVTDKRQRALATLALADVCLGQAAQPAKPKPQSRPVERRQRRE